MWSSGVADVRNCRRTRPQSSGCPRHDAVAQFNGRHSADRPIPHSRPYTGSVRRCDRLLRADWTTKHLNATAGVPQPTNNQCLSACLAVMTKLSMFLSLTNLVRYQTHPNRFQDTHNSVYFTGSRWFVWRPKRLRCVWQCFELIFQCFVELIGLMVVCRKCVVDATGDSERHSAVAAVPAPGGMSPLLSPRCCACFRRRLVTDTGKGRL